MNEIFEKDYKDFEKGIKELKGYNLDSFINYIETWCLNTAPEDILFEYVSEKKLKKEIELLQKIRFKSSSFIESNEINREFFKDLIKYKIKYSEIVTEKEEEIYIDWNMANIHKIINIDNVEDYEEKFKKINEEIDSEILKELLYKIFLLKKRTIERYCFINF